jgi:hypothetical protein
MEKTPILPMACPPRRTAAECRNLKREQALRREAMQIALQLPNNAQEALRVLEYARGLLGYVERGETAVAPSNGQGGAILRVVT